MSDTMGGNGPIGAPGLMGDDPAPEPPPPPPPPAQDLLNITARVVIEPIPNGLGRYRYTATALNVKGVIELTSPDVVTAEPVLTGHHHGVLFRDVAGEPLSYWLDID